MSSWMFLQSMTFGAMSSDSVGPQFFFVRHFMLSSTDHLHTDSDLILQHDLAMSTLKTTLSLCFTANCPEINPIQNPKIIAKGKIEDTRINNAEKLKALVKLICASLSTSHVALMQ